MDAPIFTQSGEEETSLIIADLSSARRSLTGSAWLSPCAGLPPRNRRCPTLSVGITVGIVVPATVGGAVAIRSIHEAIVAIV
jgi:hypothetical protein